MVSYFKRSWSEFGYIYSPEQCIFHILQCKMIFSSFINIHLIKRKISQHKLCMVAELFCFIFILHMNMQKWFCKKEIILAVDIYNICMKCLNAKSVYYRRLVVISVKIIFQIQLEKVFIISFSRLNLCLSNINSIFYLTDNLFHLVLFYLYLPIEV